jgi:hypothetical protein
MKARRKKEEKSRKKEGKEGKEENLKGKFTCAQENAWYYTQIV